MRGKRGRPRRRPDIVLGDRGYEHDEYRRLVWDLGVKPVIAASIGFHEAIAAHQAVTPAQRLDPGITEAVERQTRAMRELSRRAFPEPEGAPDDAPAPIAAARTQRRRQADVSHAAALRRARAERAAREAGTAAVLPQSPPLRTSA